MNSFRAGAACGVVALLAACGGGGSESDAAKPATATTYPASQAAPNDWFFYTQTSQQSIPSTFVSTRHYTRHYDQGNADGSGSYIETSSDTSPLLEVSFNSSIETVKSLNCDYSPAFRSAPPVGAASGVAYSKTSTRSCTGTVPALAVSTVSVVGKADGPESRTIPLVTFQTFKYTRTITTMTSLDTGVTKHTCWDDMATGVTVECLTEFTNTRSGATSPGAAGAGRIVLTAMGRSGQGTVGPAVQRFAGMWRVQFSGDDTGSCDEVRVALDGSVAGSCRFGSLGDSSVSLTGLVGSNGEIKATGNNGAELTGLASSSSVATGSWKLGPASGTWSARHR